MKRKKEKKQEPGAPKWMTTYSDMITLILVFFILLFSMSQIDAAKFEAVSDSFKNRMILDFFPSAVPMQHPSESGSTEGDGKDGSEFDETVDLPKSKDENEKENDNEEKDPGTGQTQEDDLQVLMENITRYLDENDLNDVITANRTERGVVLILQESILFKTAEAEVLESAKPFLNKIGGLLSENENHVKVEGHTDNRPISNYRYPSNWELSGARASSVVRYLVQENDFEMSRFSIAGYGETRPIEDNSEAKSLEKNRRVEIVILNE